MLKISSRETILLIILLGAVIFLLLFFGFISPAQDDYNEKKLELSSLQAQKNDMDNTIAAGQSLLITQEQYKTDASDIETKLLPTIKPEVIAQVLQTKFVEAGIPFFVETSSELPEYYQTMLPDGTFSNEQMVSVRFTLKVSGSDGYFPTLFDPIDTEEPTLIGFPEFMDALKDIEDDLPMSLRLYSVSLEDSGAGFMYYQVEVDAFAFMLTNRLSSPDMDQQYVTWTGPDVSTLPMGGYVGIPINLLPPTSIKVDAERPYTNVYVTKDLLPQVESLADMISQIDVEAETDQPAA